MCAAAISFARIRRLYYGAGDAKGGGVDHGVRFYSSPTCHHTPDVYSGLAEADSAAMLKAFFFRGSGINNVNFGPTFPQIALPRAVFTIALVESGRISNV